jgi:hypothetical protein
MLFSKVAFISDVRFLATTWDQGIFFNLVRGSGACGRCVTALTDWLDIKSANQVWLRELVPHRRQQELY